ncbi:MAG: hypothetical protein RLZZ519_2457, partial [Bacteroidota bacterium]
MSEETKNMVKVQVPTMADMVA